MQVSIKVVNGNAFEIHTDVLALKYAQNLYGVDRSVVQKLSKFHMDILDRLPAPGECLLLETFGAIGAKLVLFVGVNSLNSFYYQDIREFANRALFYLKNNTSSVKDVTFTLHGVGFGLDESEAFISEIAGCVDAVAGRRFPHSLERITIVEIQDRTAGRLRHLLSTLLPEGVIKIDGRGLLSNVSEGTSETFRAVGYESENKPVVFVAMPFSGNMDDIFHYGIQRAVNDAGFLCVRADMESFTGDILSWIKDKIQESTLLIADLSTANPNVYLEVGYAWGCGKPTVLLVRESKELKFDVSSQRCLVYNGSIKGLEEKLRNELENLKGQLTT